MEASESNIVQKDSRELLTQLSSTYNRKEVAETIQKHKYEEEPTRQELTNMAMNDPEGYQSYIFSLRSNARYEEGEIAKHFNEAVKDFPANPEKRKELENKVIYLDKEIPEQFLQEIRHMFPSGNFLVHGTTVEGALSIAQDKAGEIKSSAALRKENPHWRGKGGYFGVSFSYNGVGALPGTPRHMVMFATSPELVLDSQNKLTIPWLAAKNEMQLVSRNYNRETAAYINSMTDFLFGTPLCSSVISDFVELQTSLENKKGNSYIEDDLNEMKGGKLSLEYIRKQYKVVDGEIVIDKSAIEVNLTPGIIFADYLLTHTAKGQSLGKDLTTITPKELFDLQDSQKDIIRNLLRKVDNISDGMESSYEARGSIENCVMFVPSNDLEKWLDIFSTAEKTPRAFVVFSSTGGPRIPNWKLPEGHAEKANQIISYVFRKAEVPNPNLQFSEIVGKDISEADFAGETIRYLRWETIKNAKEIIKTDEGLRTIS